MIKLR